MAVNSLPNIGDATEGGWAIARSRDFVGYDV